MMIYLNKSNLIIRYYVLLCIHGHHNPHMTFINVVRMVVQFVIALGFLC